MWSEEWRVTSQYLYSSKLWSSQLWTHFKQLRIEAWKSLVWTRDLTIPVRRSNQLSYEATDIGSRSFVSSNEPVKNGCGVIYEMLHILNCGFEIKWAMIIAVMIHSSHSFVSSSEPVKNGCEVVYEMFHILNCGFEIKWALIIAVMIHSSHPFFTGTLELTNDQLPTSVAL